LFVVDAASASAQQITEFGEPLTWVNAALGTGASTISGSNSGARPTGPRGPRSIRTLDLPGLIPRDVLPYQQQTLVGSTRISPDGRTLAASGSSIVMEGRHELVTIDLTTLAATVRWSRGASEPYLDLAELRWLPDQSGFITLATGVSTTRVAHLDLATGILRYLTDPIGFAILPSIDLSPDGRTIAYSREDGLTRFITMDGAPAPGYPETIGGILPAFSPDGKLLAYSRRGTLHPGGLDGIWIHRFSDSQEWRLLPEESPVTWVLDWE